MTDPSPPLLPEGWAELAPLVDQLLDAPRAERPALLETLSGGDPARRVALVGLLADCEQGLPLMDRPAVERFDQLAGMDPGPPLPEILGGRYRIERELGQGGMARVYLAQDLKHARHVAVKVIRPELAASLGRDRFLREIGIAARLRHPNIMPLYDSGDADGVLYFVMPFEAGPSLRASLAGGGGLPIAEAVSILRDVARALGYAHEQGVVHRDIKPDNVMVSGGAAVVTDFGIAKAVSAARTAAGSDPITQTGSVIGTPAYMAPEQGMGDPATDHRADIYAFGCLAYELLTGQPPFAGTTTFQIVAAHLTTVPKLVSEVRAEVPGSVAHLIAGCLEKDPAARPQSAEELINQLGTFSVAHPLSPPRLRRAPVLIGLLLALVAVSLLAWYLSRPGGPVTVAVLPLGSTGGDTTQARMAEGFSDDIADALVKVPWVRIRSRRGALSYSGQSEIDPCATALALGVQYLVTGGFRTQDGSRTLTVRLESCEDASTLLWAEQFDQLGNLAGVRDVITKTVGDSLLSRAGRGFRPQAVSTAPGRRGNNAAYLQYLLGKERMNRRTITITPSIELFRSATELDSLSAEAWSGLSMALALRPRFENVRTESVMAEADSAARRALRLNPQLAEPHVALGMLHEYRWRWDLAEAEYQAALALDGNDVEARLQYSFNLRLRDRLEESTRHLLMAREDDPLSAVVASQLAYNWFLEGQVDSALAESAKARMIDPSNLTAITLGAMVELGAGHPDVALELMRRRPPTAGMVLYVVGATGDRVTVLERLRMLDSVRPTPPLFHTARAFAMLGLGDTAQALDALERATDAREIWFWGSGSPSGPMLAGVRESPRFQAILRRVGLAQE